MTEKTKIPSEKHESIEKILVENFVSFQKVMVNLSIKFEDLSNKISKLLELFEISAKTLAEKGFDYVKEDKEAKRILETVDSLLDQNKTIAKGMTMMYEKFSEISQGYEKSHPESTGNSDHREASSEKEGLNFEGYEKSLNVDNSSESMVQSTKFKKLPIRENAQE